MSRNIRQQQGYRGVRTGSWAKSKWTNQSAFDPGDTEIEQVLEAHDREIQSDDGTSIIIKPVHPDFLLPLDRQAIVDVLGRIPDAFTKDLKAIVCLGGSKKQARVSRSVFSYGRYFEGTVWLHPYPRSAMEVKYKKPPKPNELQDYRRAGARIVQHQGSVLIQFDRKSLRQFYLRDVLLHEIGHHNDYLNGLSKRHRKSEGFADWFASEYGYRLR